MLATPAQLAVLVSAPVLLLGAVDVAARRERTLYIASILAVAATSAFILNLTVVGAVFNMRPAPFAFALWGGFALAVAYACGLRLVLAGGITMVMIFLRMAVGRAAGVAGGSRACNQPPAQDRSRRPGASRDSAPRSSGGGASNPGSRTSNC
jgi:hypothetical protein